MNKKPVNSDTSIEHLREISTWVSSVQNLDQILELIIATATRMMNAQASSLLLLDKKTKKLHFKVATGKKKDAVRKYEVSLGQGIAGYVAEKGEPLVIPDVNKDPRWYKEISESIGFKTHSIACVPMILKNETIGVVEIIDRADRSPFLNEDIKILTVFAELAALAIGNAKKIQKDKSEIKDLREKLDFKYQIIGDSKAIMAVISDAVKVANSKTTTLIVGESGTGKELLARLIHRAGPRENMPLIVLNCAALPESLMEDELFGHEKGAFTGAEGQKIGKFEQADGGTIFLDEIGEMSPGMQAKLLRVLQEGIFYRVGGITPIYVDVRVISATNKNITDEVTEGRFREDLYYRLNVVQIHMPSLRKRKEDIPLLAQYFLKTFNQEKGVPHLTLSKKALEMMLQYDWPGNVRELKNAIERAVVMGNAVEITPEDLLISSPKAKFSGLQLGLTLEEALNAFKKEFIKLNLRDTGGNRSKAAKVMSIQRTYLSRLISKYKIE
jgi:Nif-specific regulatory protein